MAKTKNKKTNLAEAAAQKKNRDKKKSTNPFEVHINKDKQKVLGRKLKADRGLPGVSRSKALKKRKHTLLQEFTQKDKDNVFMDRRIGERNSAMTPEEKSMARYAAEKIKAHKKKDLYSLNDEEILTHRGQTLEEIEKFDDPKSDDEFSDDDRKGHLDKRFVEEAHFGGGILSKPDASKSGKDVLAQLIADSKKAKAEKQKVREQTIDLTEKLDSGWKDLLPLMASIKRTTEEPRQEKTKIDDYDRAVRELKFESRGNPSDRLKSEEEIMKEEKEKLEALEQDRLARMKGFLNDSDSRVKHRSADDLDDGLHLEEINEEPLAYGEDGLLKGVVINPQNAEGDGSDDENTNEKNSEQNDHDNDDEDDEKDENNSVSMENSNENENELEDEEESDAEDAEEAEDEEDDLSDLKVSESSSDEDEKGEEPAINGRHSGQSITKKEKVTENDEPEERTSCEQLNDDTKNDDRIKEIREDLQRRKEIMEKARQELPYTYSAPETFEELQQLLKDQGPEHQSIILERIIKCNHWSLNQGNREKLCKVFEYLLQYVVNCSRVNKPKDIIKAFQITDRLCSHLFDLALASAQNTATCVQTLVKEKHEDFKKNQKKYPGLDTLIIFKLVSLLFPTSDFRHPVVTPCLVFMSQILLRCHVKSKTDISKGLFIVSLVLEYTLMSKRFAPSAINFLRGVVYLATVKPPPLLPKIIPPFKRAGEFSNLLILEESQKDITIEPAGTHMNARDLSPGDINEDFKVRALLTAINLINEFKNQLEELEAVQSIFEPIMKLLALNSWKNYPKNVRQHVKKLRTELKSLADKKLEYLVREKKKPKALRLYEPRIERIYDGKKHRPMSKEKAELEKLKHKIKKEMKGAIREIRRDTSFLAKVHIKQQVQSDQERKRKVKEIFGDAATQQGELNQIKRKK